MRATSLTCLYCAKPLDTLDQRRGVTHCGAAACRHEAGRAALKVRWQRVAAMAVERASALLPGDATRPGAVLWMRPALQEQECVDDALRESLASAWRDAVRNDQRREHDGPDSAQALPGDATVLCAQCGGSCCTHGRPNHAFIDAAVLARWCTERPGTGAEDAIADYIARLPATHIRGGCAFQTATGCHLPRDMRADICNRYVCEPLQALGQAVENDPGHSAVVLTADGRQLQRAAVLHRGQLQPLAGLPDPDDLPS